MNVYAMRVNLSVAIVYMAEPGVFNWNEKEKVVMMMMMMMMMMTMTMMTTREWSSACSSTATC